jgi:TusA-related sulfurtransferase
MRKADSFFLFNEWPTAGGQQENRVMSENRVVDARNTFCPGPLMELISNMKMAKVGDTIELLSTDEGSGADVPEWVNKVGHEIVSNEKVDGVWHIKVRKAK